MKFFKEEHVAHSTALHSLYKGQVYQVGPLARYSLHYERLPVGLQNLARENKMQKEIRNPFRSIQVRAVETIYAVSEAIAILKKQPSPGKPSVEAPVQKGGGHGASEAPRGLLYHHYQVNDEGEITAANIVPPTAQNQKCIEADLESFINENISLEDKEMKWKAEQSIRNYDPCISCSTHFLQLKVDRD